MLGHKNSTVTRSVYVQEVKSAERRAKLRSRMEARHQGLLSGSDIDANAVRPEGQLLDLQRKGAQ